MRWQDFRRSDNVEELGSSGSSGFGGGGIRLGGGAILLVIVVSLILGKNPLDVLALLSGDGGAPTQVQTQPAAPTEAAHPPTPRDAQKDFVRAVLGDTEDFWGGTFRQMGSRYQPPKPGLF